MAQRHVKQPIYLRERKLFDAWARWSERNWDESLGPPRVTWIARLMQWGERMGMRHVASDHLPLDHSEEESVEQYMEWLKKACPPMHAALMARHRGIVIERRLAGPAKPKESYYAACILEDGSPAGVQRFRRLCEQGYRLYRDGAGRPLSVRA